MNVAGAENTLASRAASRSSLLGFTFLLGLVFMASFYINAKNFVGAYGSHRKRDFTPLA